MTGPSPVFCKVRFFTTSFKTNNYAYFNSSEVKTIIKTWKINCQVQILNIECDLGLELTLVKCITHAS